MDRPPDGLVSVDPPKNRHWCAGQRWSVCCTSLWRVGEEDPA